MLPFVDEEDARVLHVSAFSCPHATFFDLVGNWVWKDGFEPASFLFRREIAVFEEEGSCACVLFVVEEGLRIGEEEGIGVDEEDFSERGHENCKGLHGPALKYGISFFFFGRSIRRAVAALRELRLTFQGPALIIHHLRKISRQHPRQSFQLFSIVLTEILVAQVKHLDG